VMTDAVLHFEEQFLDILTVLVRHLVIS